jgi:pyruvate dehydrogenase complex dehydrogenase (E1) component
VKNPLKGWFSHRDIGWPVDDDLGENAHDGGVPPDKKHRDGDPITAIIRWNGLAIVVRATATCGELGGQVAATPPAPRFLRGLLSVLSCYPILVNAGLLADPDGVDGRGMISGVYRSRFIRYLRDRGLLATDGWRVWGIFGDGEWTSRNQSPASR